MSVLPTVAGQPTLAVRRRPRRAALHKVGTLICCAYQNQLSENLRLGSNSRLLTMPCSAGETPVTSVVWLG